VGRGPESAARRRWSGGGRRQWLCDVAGRHQSCDAAGRPEVDARRAWQVGPAVVECCAWLAGLAAERRASRWPHAAPSRQGQQSSGRALLLEGCRRADRSNKEIRATIIFFLVRNEREWFEGVVWLVHCASRRRVQTGGDGWMSWTRHHRL
jgi:cytochrome P450